MTTGLSKRGKDYHIAHKWSKNKQTSTGDGKDIEAVATKTMDKGKEATEVTFKAHTRQGMNVTSHVSQD
jgi:hypothetical protein